MDIKNCRHCGKEIKLVPGFVAPQWVHLWGHFRTCESGRTLAEPEVTDTTKNS